VRAWALRGDVFHHGIFVRRVFMHTVSVRSLHSKRTRTGPGIECVGINTSPIAGVAITFPVSALITPSFYYRSPRTNAGFAMSIARPEGSWHGASGHGSRHFQIL